MSNLLASRLRRNRGSSKCQIDAKYWMLEGLMSWKLEISRLIALRCGEVGGAGNESYIGGDLRALCRDDWGDSRA